jgi:hypothetical protein
MNTIFSFILAASVLTLFGCTPATGRDATTNDTWRLDEMARRDTPSAEFAQSIERFYESIEKKDWPTTYDMRTADFKQDVPRSDYLKEMANRPENLTSYRVLDVHTYAGPVGGYNAAEIIMEFHEGGMVSYSCAKWIRRFGKWLCLDPGLSGYLINTRVPDWVTQ